MKKGFSISLAVLMLVAMFHISIATHYCNGNLAGSKISFSGKQASCGMEGAEKDLLLPVAQIKSHCCDDFVACYVIDINYTPTFPSVSENFHNNFHVFSIPLEFAGCSSAVFHSSYSCEIPPGVQLSTNVDLSGICVFRI